MFYLLPLHVVKKKHRDSPRPAVTPARPARPGIRWVQWSQWFSGDLADGLFIGFTRPGKRLHSY